MILTETNSMLSYTVKLAINAEHFSITEKLDQTFCPKLVHKVVAYKSTLHGND